MECLWGCNVLSQPQNTAARPWRTGIQKICQSTCFIITLNYWWNNTASWRPAIFPPLVECLLPNQHLSLLILNKNYTNLGLCCLFLCGYVSCWLLWNLLTGWKIVSVIYYLLWVPCLKKNFFYAFVVIVGHHSFLEKVILSTYSF